MPTKKKVTLEMVYAKLLAHDRRFDKQDRRFAKQDRRFAAQDRRFATQDQTLRRFEQRFDQHERHFKKIHTKLEQHDRQFDKNDRKFDGLMKLLFRMEDSLRSEMRSIVDRLRQLEATVESQTGELETLRQEYFAIREGLSRLEKSFEGLQRKIVTRADLDAIESRLDKVETRLAVLESAPR